MKFLPLVWAGLWRRPLRTTLTALCIVVAFVLLGLLEGVNAGFARAIASAHRELLITGTRVRGGAPMPIGAIRAMRAIPGVKEVAPRAYFVGIYRDPGPRNTIVALATEADAFFHVVTGLQASPQAIRALDATRTGMLATRALMSQWGWKVGDRIVLRNAAPKSDGSHDWTFDIVGVIEAPQAQASAYFGVINYDYFNTSRTVDRDTAEMFYVRIADPDQSIATAARIDRIFANSSHETRTRSQQVRAEQQSRQMGDVKFFTDAIIGAVLFTLAFLTGNTLRQALQERTREFAVLKAVGYTNRGVLCLAYAEAVLLCLPPAATGLLVAWLAAPLAKYDFGSIVVSARVAGMGLLCAACLAIVGAALPALRLSRMSIARAIGKPIAGGG